MTGWIFQELVKVLCHDLRPCENQARMAIETFTDFWPYYVRAHTKPRTRVLHAIGSLLALAFIAAGVFLNPWLFLAAPVIGYAFAWYGHFFIEHNKPATFGHPFYSLAADYVMLWKTLTGSMNDEVARLHNPERSEGSREPPRRPSP